MENLCLQEKNCVSTQTDEIENEKVIKQRHGCVTFWLVIMIVINSLAAIAYLFSNIDMFNNSKTITILLGIFSIVNVICAVMLLKWKKLGFWGCIVSSIVALIINLHIGIGVSVSGLLGVVILFGVLQIRKNKISAWDNLE